MDWTLSNLKGGSNRTSY